MLERRKIRELAVTLLKASSLLAGVTIGDTLASDFDETELPAINVYTASDSWATKGAGLHTPRGTVSLTLTFEIWVAGAGADADDIVEKIESVLFTDTTFIAEISGIRSATGQMAAKQDGSKALIHVLQAYVIEFDYEFAPAPPDTLESVEITLDAIDPADPNTGNPGYVGGTPGPEGRTEGVVTIEPEAV